MSNAAVALKDLYKVDAKLVYPFVEAVVNTLKVQCRLEATMGKPIFKDLNTEDKLNVLIQATITSKDSLATVSICFSNKLFFALMGRMLGETYTELTPELEDGAKELMNIVFNQAKKPLADKGLAAVRSIPTVVFGGNLLVRYLSRGQPMVLPFETEFGHFSMEICTQEITVSDSVSGGGK